MPISPVAPLVAGIPGGNPSLHGLLATFAGKYVAAHLRVLQDLPVEAIVRAIDLCRSALATNRRIFIFGNGGSAANASHFATDLGKGASDALGRRFKVISLTDHVAWLTAIGNDYAYEDVFVRQMENYAAVENGVTVENEKWWSCRWRKFGTTGSSARSPATGTESAA